MLYLFEIEFLDMYPTEIRRDSDSDLNGISPIVWLLNQSLILAKDLYKFSTGHTHVSEDINCL